jgi:hypothetical protein
MVVWVVVSRKQPIFTAVKTSILHCELDKLCIEFDYVYRNFKKGGEKNLHFRGSGKW